MFIIKKSDTSSVQNDNKIRKKSKIKLFQPERVKVFGEEEHTAIMHVTTISQLTTRKKMENRKN